MLQHQCLEMVYLDDDVSIVYTKYITTLFEIKLYRHGVTKTKRKIY